MIRYNELINFIFAKEVSDNLSFDDYSLSNFMEEMGFDFILEGHEVDYSVGTEPEAESRFFTKIERRMDELRAGGYFTEQIDNMIVALKEKEAIIILKYVGSVYQEYFQRYL